MPSCPIQVRDEFEWSLFPSFSLQLNSYLPCFFKQLQLIEQWGHSKQQYYCKPSTVLHKQLWKKESFQGEGQGEVKKFNVHVRLPNNADVGLLQWCGWHAVRTHTSNHQGQKGSMFFQHMLKESCKDSSFCCIIMSQMSKQYSLCDLPEQCWHLHFPCVLSNSSCERPQWWFCSLTVNLIEKGKTKQNKTKDRIFFPYISFYLDKFSLRNVQLPFNTQLAWLGPHQIARIR